VYLDYFTIGMCVMSLLIGMMGQLTIDLLVSKHYEKEMAERCAGCPKNPVEGGEE